MLCNKVKMLSKNLPRESMVLLNKVVVAEMQGSGGTDVFSTFKKFKTLQPAKQGYNCDGKRF